MKMHGATIRFIGHSYVQYVTHLKVVYLLCSSLWTDILVLHKPSA